MRELIAQNIERLKAWAVDGEHGGQMTIKPKYSFTTHMSPGVLRNFSAKCIFLVETAFEIFYCFTQERAQIQTSTQHCSVIRKMSKMNHAQGSQTDQAAQLPHRNSSMDR